MTCNRTLSWLALPAAFALHACGEPPDQAGSDAANRTGASPRPSPTSGPDEAGPSPIAEEKGEAGARRVLLAWARALERKDFAAAHGLSGEQVVNVPDLADRLEGLRAITVTTPAGQMEGAAGTLYYQVPVTVAGTSESGARVRLQGPVVVRRANDIPGATAEQLRWHLDSIDLKPVN